MNRVVGNVSSSKRVVKRYGGKSRCSEVHVHPDKDPEDETKQSDG